MLEARDAGFSFQFGAEPSAIRKVATRADNRINRWEFTRSIALERRSDCADAIGAVACSTVPLIPHQTGATK